MMSYLKFWLTMEQRAGIYIPEPFGFAHENLVDERINFYKALLSEVEGTLIEELGFVYPHYFT